MGSSKALNPKVELELITYERTRIADCGSWRFGGATLGV